MSAEATPVQAPAQAAPAATAKVRRSVTVDGVVISSKMQ